jgi:nucleoside-diphosphate-sugar epimerase
MKVLVMGGTRFVGRPLVANLLGAGHDLTLFTRGKNPLPDNIESLTGDRNDDEALAQLQGRRFDVIVDSSGRECADTRRVIERTGAPAHRFVYVSSAGVYANSDLWPLDEDAPLDPSSRHAGKAETEAWLRQQGIAFTSFRPTYIVGAGNYNPIERWFFDRLTHDQPVPIPGDGSTITQLGHVNDLAMAMARSLEVEAACNRIYNCSGNQGVTFAGLVTAAARACGKDPATVELLPFAIEGLDSKARKAFPLRLSHFLTDTHRVRRELAWQPAFDLEATLADSWENDYQRLPRLECDFSADEVLKKRKLKA